MAYTRTTTVDAGPSGDTTKQAVLDCDTDLTGIFTHLNTHEALTTAAHGITAGMGVIASTQGTETLTNKTISAPTITGAVAASGATVSGGTFSTPTLTGTIPASGATIQSPTITGATLVAPALGTPASGNLANCTFPLTMTPATTGFAIAGGTASKTLTVTGDATIAGTPSSLTSNAPVTQAYGDTAAVGSGTEAAKDDHKHGMPASAKDTTAVTGILKGNGSAISAASAGTDYQAPNTDSASDHISEVTAAHGVAIDGLTIKDSGFVLGSDADGDIYYRASSALARLAKGTANLKMFMNAAGTAPEWAGGLKVLTWTRDLSLTNGNISYTGVGFKPSSMLLIAAPPSSGIDGGSWGLHGGSTRNGISRYSDGKFYATFQTFGNSTVACVVSAGNYVDADFVSYDEDGLTLSYTKTGSPTGTWVFTGLLFR